LPGEFGPGGHTEFAGRRGGWDSTVRVLRKTARPISAVGAAQPFSVAEVGAGLLEGGMALLV